jgi:1-acyl-sn-glycerol-3-phosphate acyltransferase
VTKVAASQIETGKQVIEARPYRWALSFWARWLRKLGRRWFVRRHVERFCRPLTVDGAGQLDHLAGPAIIIANHTSHFDTLIVLNALPMHIFERTAVVAAADRFYTKKIKSMWHSLRYNAFPISRGGGRAALDYSQQLLRDGWSLLIFPEGRRSRSGQLLPFHPGPAILALSQRVPFVPIHIEGAINTLPAGEQRARPAPVHVRVGAPVWLDPGTGVMEATERMQEAVQALAARDGRPSEEPVLVA